MHSNSRVLATAIASRKYSSFAFVLKMKLISQVSNWHWNLETNMLQSSHKSYWTTNEIKLASRKNYTLKKVRGSTFHPVLNQNKWNTFLCTSDLASFSWTLACFIALTVRPWKTAKWILIKMIIWEIQQQRHAGNQLNVIYHLNSMQDNVTTILWHLPSRYLQSFQI